ncbi:hypothetical protein MEN41_17670 [Dolichospermum sp. ST_con]|nr:hypothetical protein [Dolichospermum sp. ST_con]
MSSIGKFSHSHIFNTNDEELEKFIKLNSKKISDLEYLYKQTVSIELRSFLRKIANINNILKGLDAISYPIIEGSGDLMSSSKTDDDIPSSLNLEVIKKLILSKELFADNSEKSPKELLKEIDTKLIPFMEKYSKIYTELLNEWFQADCEFHGRIDKEMNEELLAKAMNRETTYMDMYSSLYDGDF